MFPPMSAAMAVSKIAATAMATRVSIRVNPSAPAIPAARLREAAVDNFNASSQPRYADFKVDTRPGEINCSAARHSRREELDCCAACAGAASVCNDGAKADIARQLY